MRFFRYLIVFVLAVMPGAGLGQHHSHDASATGTSRAFNPSISLNGLFYAMASSEDDPLWDELGLSGGLHLQEASLEFTSNVDIYLKAKMVISMDGEGEVGLEEAYVTTLRMPIPVTVKAGQMLNILGRHNLYHVHHMAFAEHPMILHQVFGPDLLEVGAEVSYLVPLPWYMDITGGVINGDNEYLLENDDPDELGYLVHIDNMWDLEKGLALRLGASYVTGKKNPTYADGTLISEDINDVTSQVWGVDFHVKWRPEEYSRDTSITLQGEYVEATMDYEDDPIDDPMRGFFVQVLTQVKNRYWLQARYGWFNRPSELHPFFPEPVELDYDMTEDLEADRLSFALAYVPTEFSSFRLQYNISNMEDHTEYQTIFQLNYTIGSHPAHKY